MDVGKNEGELQRHQSMLQLEFHFPQKFLEASGGT